MVGATQKCTEKKGRQGAYTKWGNFISVGFGQSPEPAVVVNVDMIDFKARQRCKGVGRLQRSSNMRSRPAAKDTDDIGESSMTNSTTEAVAA